MNKLALLLLALSATPVLAQDDGAVYRFEMTTPVLSFGSDEEQAPTGLSVATPTEMSVAQFAMTSIEAPAHDGAAPSAYALTGSLPVGLSFDETTGIISGKATGAGGGTYTIEVTDSEGRRGQTEAFSVVVPPTTAVRANFSNRTSATVYVNGSVHSGNNIQPSAGMTVEIRYPFPVYADTFVFSGGSYNANDTTKGVVHAYIDGQWVLVRDGNGQVNWHPAWGYFNRHGDVQTSGDARTVVSDRFRWTATAGGAATFYNPYANR